MTTRLDDEMTSRKDQCTRPADAYIANITQANMTGRYHVLAEDFVTIPFSSSPSSATLAAPISPSLRKGELASAVSLLHVSITVTIMPQISSYIYLFPPLHAKSFVHNHSELKNWIY